MRALLAALMILGVLSAAEAQVKIERAYVERRGIYKIEKIDTIKNKSISTGQRTVATKITFTRSTDRIYAADSVVFGVDVFVRGRPSGRKVPVRIVWHYPKPGLRNPGIPVTSNSATNTWIDVHWIAKSTFYWNLWRSLDSGARRMDLRNVVRKMQAGLADLRADQVAGQRPRRAYLAEDEFSFGRSPR